LQQNTRAMWLGLQANDAEIFVDVTYHGRWRGGGGLWLWIFIHDTDKLDRGLKALEEA